MTLFYAGYKCLDDPEWQGAWVKALGRERDGLCRQLVDRSILVTEEEIASAMRLVIRSHHVLVEGAAGVAVAGFLRDRDAHAGRKVAIILCGANASLEVLGRVLA